MSITLFCLVKGKTTANAFEVDIEKDKSISKLKEAIKAKKQNDFAGIDADRLKLWKVPISDDHVDPLNNPSLEDGEELLAINEIGDYWTEKPPKKHIHVIVEQPASTATSNREQELLEEIASLKEKFSNSVHDFDVVVRPKQKATKWTVNIKQASLEGLKDHIRKIYKPSALENDGAELNFMNDGKKYSPRNDQDLREILLTFVSKDISRFIVVIETPSKPFNEWTFPKVCQLYGISDDPSPSIDVYPRFICGCVEFEDEKSRTAVKNLMTELKLRIKTTPLDMAYEATKSIYSYCYLASGVSFYEDDFKIIPEKLIEGRNGQGNLDYAIECRSTGRILGLIEVKREDFMKGFAQASVQMESSLTGRKRKANEINDEQDVDKVFGIVTDARDWYFMECTLDIEGKPSFKLSEPVSVVYKSDNMQIMVEEVLGHIVWLLEEAQKTVTALNVDKEREIKRVKSTDDLAVKSK